MRHAQIFHILTCVKIIFKIVIITVTWTVTSFEHTVGTEIAIPDVSLHTHTHTHTHTATPTPSRAPAHAHTHASALAQTSAHTHRTSVPSSCLLKLCRCYQHSRSLCCNGRTETTMPTASVLVSVLYAPWGLILMSNLFKGTPFWSH
jgi:hypothetical protein